LLLFHGAFDDTDCGAVVGDDGMISALSELILHLSFVEMLKS